MSKLTFDDAGTKFLENGVDHGILFVFDGNKNSLSNAQEGYAAGVAWNGLISVAQNPEGAENEDIYADNIKYATLTSAETFGATITAYTYPDEFEKCDGNVTKKGVSLGQQKRVPFAFAYRTSITNDEGVDAHKIHIVYGAKASPSEREYSTTTDSPEGMEMSWEVSTTGINATVLPTGVDNLKPISHIAIDEYLKGSDGKLNTDTQNTVYTTIEQFLLGTNGSQGTEGTDSALPSVNYIIGLMNAQ